MPRAEPAIRKAPANDPYMLRDAKRRANKARNFPTNTCGASRHVHMFVDLLLDRKRKGRPIEEYYEVEHIAGSLLTVIACLWEARTKLDEMEAAAVTAAATEDRA